MKITSSHEYAFFKKKTMYAKKVYPMDKSGLESVIIIPGISFLGTDRYKCLQKYLAHNAVSSISFDFSGIGNSMGDINKTTLSDLTEDTNLLLKKYGTGHKYIIGYSIGGYIAIKLLKKLKNVDGLILISPPIFSESSDTMLLNEENRNLIKSNFQDSNSILFNLLETFKKRCLILFGNSDEKIIKSVIERHTMIRNPLVNLVLLKNGSHALLNDKTEEEKLVKENMFEEILKFIKNE
jgi:hypothetical protein